MLLVVAQREGGAGGGFRALRTHSRRAAAVSPSGPHNGSRPRIRIHSVTVLGGWIRQRQNFPFHWLRTRWVNCWESKGVRSRVWCCLVELLLRKLQAAIQQAKLLAFWTALFSAGPALVIIMTHSQSPLHLLRMAFYLIFHLSDGLAWRICCFFLLSSSKYIK